MNDWKDVFYNAVERLENATDGKTKVRYECIRGNGSWLWVNSKDNDGRGVDIGVSGYKEAAHIVEGMYFMACIDRNGTTWMPRKEK